MISNFGCSCPAHEQQADFGITSHIDFCGVTLMKAGSPPEARYVSGG